MKIRGVNWKNETLIVAEKFFIHKEKGKLKTSGIESMKRLFEPNDVQNIFWKKSGESITRLTIKERIAALMRFLKTSIRVIETINTNA